MKTSLAIVAAAAVLLAGIALTDLFGSDDSRAPEPTTPTAPSDDSETPALADGEWFGFLDVTRDGDRIVVTFDEAEMLSGEEARIAAIEAGVIGPDEQLPNDFFIDNADERFVEIEVGDDAEFFVLDGTNPGTEIVTNIDGLESLISGAYDGPPVYGIAVGMPVAMNVEILGGSITAAHAVYLP